jgi:ATP-binding cassette subfamily B protein
LPCIVHWNQNHFVVVYKIKKHRKGNYTVYVADPGKGLVTYNKEEFCEYWISTRSNGEEKGIALLLNPTEHFYNQTDTQKKRHRTEQDFCGATSKSTNASFSN